VSDGSVGLLFSDVWIALISQGVPQLGGVKQRWDGKQQVFIHTRQSRAYLALARLSCRSSESLRLMLFSLLFHVGGRLIY